MMFAFTTALVKPDGAFSIYNGVLSPTPAEIRSRSRVSSLLSQTGSGWSKDDWGYHSYSFETPSGDRIVFFGIIVDGVRPSRRFSGIDQTFQRKQVEEIAKGMGFILEQEESATQLEAANLIHDLRSLSTTIYHSANEAEIFLAQNAFGEVGIRLRNIEAAQGLLKIRIDAYDFLGNSNALRDHRDIQIFRRVDKVARFLKPKAGESRKTIRLSGQSYRKVFGPDLFELIPYTIIDNAVKYSPDGSVISVDVQDSVLTRVIVTSLGPRISKHEQDLIFARGKRGDGAVASGLPGTGLGLFVARRIVEEIFSGSIHVQQSPTASLIDGRNVYETTFTIEIPST